jgi:hypothetical protein
MTESGAPDGFEDVVATLNPIADDQPDLPAHWSVTFAVDDAEATADMGADLGGRVVVAPFDAPWVRMTIISDPQGGATFTASKFVPENQDLTTRCCPATGCNVIGSGAAFTGAKLRPRDLTRHAQTSRSDRPPPPARRKVDRSAGCSARYSHAGTVAFSDTSEPCERGRRPLEDVTSAGAAGTRASRG